MFSVNGLVLSVICLGLRVQSSHPCCVPSAPLSSTLEGGPCESSPLSFFDAPSSLIT